MLQRALALIVLGFLLQSSTPGAQGDITHEPVGNPQVATESLPPGARIEPVLTHVNNPVAMTFAPDGHWFFTERTTGLVQMVGGGLVVPVFQVNPFVGNERGLIGIALDPNFASNGFIYLYYTSNEDQPNDGRLDNRVVRFRLQDGFVGAKTLMLRVPLDSDFTEIHNGGNLHFGPDGKLYIAIGDYNNPPNAQNPGVFPGKIHRFNLSAPLSAPPDNPFPANSAFAFGFRNPFDFDFDPISGQVFAGENGTSCDDEVNRVLSGYNYGWRSGYPACEDASAGGPNPTFNSIPPLMFWSQSVVPTGVTFYRGDLFPEWKNDLFVCHWKTGELHHFKLNGARTAIASHTIIQDRMLGTSVCHLDVETGTGGALYFFRNDESDPNFQYRDIYRITRDATVYASTFSASPPNPSAGSALAYDMRLVHYGTQTTTFTLTAGLPPSTALALDSLQAASGQLTGSGTGVTWTGSILPNTTLTATYRVTVSDQIVAPTILTNVMHIASDRADSIDRVAIAIANGQAAYLPIVLRSSTP